MLDQLAANARVIEVQALGTREQFELIRTYFQRDPLDPSVTLGNGDDAAVVSQRSDFETVVSVDSVIAGRRSTHVSA